VLKPTQCGMQGTPPSRIKQSTIVNTSLHHHDPTGLPISRVVPESSDSDSDPIADGLDMIISTTRTMRASSSTEESDTGIIGSPNASIEIRCCALLWHLCLSTLDQFSPWRSRAAFTAAAHVEVTLGCKKAGATRVVQLGHLKHEALSRGSTHGGVYLLGRRSNLRPQCSALHMYCQDFPAIAGDVAIPE
jgi:hypothetical protein